MPTPSVLIVEDAETLAETYTAYLRDSGYRTTTALTARAALDAIEANVPNVVVLDLNLPDADGMDLLREIRTKGLPIEVLVITGRASVQVAVDAMRYGAFDFLTKPFNADRFRTTVRNAIERNKLASEVETQKEEYSTGRFVGFIGSSLAMQAVYRILQSAAASKATVFVTGESGTGKELCAEALHKLGSRKARPFVAINCAAIPRDLLESEIFGHEKGAFTGATATRKGAALLADGGTLFLDEICEMDLSMQAKMLRFLQTGTVQRVGADKPQPVDVRIVCATNRDPIAEVAAGRFREDLFYRLHVVPIALPPLRDRDDDVLMIARTFLEQFTKQEHKKFRRFATSAEQAISAYNWPGNVRELQNVVRAVVVLNDGEAVESTMLPHHIAGTSKPGVTMPPTTGGGDLVTARPDAVNPVVVERPSDHPMEGAPIRPLEEVIRTTIETAIARCDGSVTRAATSLEVSPSTIYRRLQAWQAEDAAGRTESAATPEA